jgi:hypothetical protein
MVGDITLVYNQGGCHYAYCLVNGIIVLYLLGVL